MGAPKWPPNPQRSEHPGAAVALLDGPVASYTPARAGAAAADSRPLGVMAQAAPPSW
jgi:hypothetical protein